MPQIINAGGELLRINPNNNTIESSTNGGRSWIIRCSDSRSYGTFADLLPFEHEVLAATNKGLYASSNNGRSFAPRCINPSYGHFINLQAQGSTLLANTTQGLLYSTNGGRSWVRR